MIQLLLSDLQRVALLLLKKLLSICQLIFLLWLLPNIYRLFLVKALPIVLMKSIHSMSMKPNKIKFLKPAAFILPPETGILK